MELREDTINLDAAYAMYRVSGLPITFDSFVKIYGWRWKKVFNTAQEAIKWQ